MYYKFSLSPYPGAYKELTHLVTVVGDETHLSHGDVSVNSPSGPLGYRHTIVRGVRVAGGG